MGSAKRPPPKVKDLALKDVEVTVAQIRSERTEVLRVSRREKDQSRKKSRR